MPNVTRQIIKKNQVFKVPPNVWRLKIVTENTFQNKLAAAVDFRMAIDEDGAMFGWGINTSGQLGIGTSALTASTPTAVVAPAGWIGSGIAYGWDYVTYNSENGSMGIDRQGRLYTWGANQNTLGQLGQGSLVAAFAVSTPVQIAAAARFLYGQWLVSNTSAGFALDVEGNLWSWGSNTGGIGGTNLNPGVVTAQSVPVQVVGGHQFTAFWENLGTTVFATDVSGNLWSWGPDVSAWGTHGNGTFGQSFSSPVQVAFPNGTIVTNYYSTGSGTSFALDINGNLWSWGSNAGGVLGQGLSPATTTAVSSPVQIAGISGVVDFQVSGNSGNVIAIDNQGRMWSWGPNSQFTLGQNNPSALFAVSTPVQITPAGATIVKFLRKPPNNMMVGSIIYNGVGTSYLNQVMVLDSNGNIWSWGLNSNGNLGVGNVNIGGFISSPTQVVGGKSWTNGWLCNAGLNAFFVDNAGLLWSVGTNSNGNLGINTLPGTIAAVSSPTQVSMPNNKTVQGFMSDENEGGSGGRTFFALTGGGDMYVWGEQLGGVGGSFGIGTSAFSFISSPTQVSFPAAGTKYTLAQTQQSTYIDVTPGQNYLALVNGYFCWFGGRCVGSKASQMTLEFTQ